jgi:hypothetical protein
MKHPPTPPPPARVIYIRHAYPRMDETQLRRALASVPPDDPRLVAIRQLIDEELGAAFLEVSMRDRTPEQRAHAAGSIAALADLKNRLEEITNY